MISSKKHPIGYEFFDLWEDNIAIISPDGVITYTNKSWKQFAQHNGLNPDECDEGTNYFKVCDDATGANSDEASIAAEGIRDVISGKKSIFKHVYPCHSPDEKRWFLLKVTPLSKTYPTSVLLQHIDITERKEAELALKEKEKQIKKAQSIGNTGSWHFDLSTGKTTISEESYRIYGLEIGKIYTITEVQKIPLPEYRPMLDDALEKLVNGEREYDVEFKIKRPSDGCIVDIHSVAEYDSQENTVTGIIQDITERNQNLQRIDFLTDTLRCIRDVNQTIVKESNPDDLLQEVCDSLVRYNSYTNVWICLFDENKKINVIKESGFRDKFEEFIYDLKNVGLLYCVRRVLKERDYITLDDPVNECIDCPLKDEEKGTSIFVSKLQYGPKEYGIISLSIPEKHAKDEEIISLCKEVVGDISFSLYNLELEATRQKAEESLIEGKIVAEEANRTKSEFLANMSHELRTPLNSVLGFSQVLKKNTSNHLDDKEIKYVSNVLKSGTHLLDLINDILDLSKVESGKMDYEPESVNIDEIIDSTITLVSPMAKKKSIDLHVSFKHEYSDIQADRSKFKEIMYNLLSNAIKFTPEKGEVQVITKIIDEKLHVFVSDTGIGIPEAKFKDIFDPFKQVDSSANRKFGGTGLGLSLVKKYVEMHSGEIWVESELGEGSTFTFTIPFV